MAMQETQPDPWFGKIYMWRELLSATPRLLSPRTSRAQAPQPESAPAGSELESGPGGSQRRAAPWVTAGEPRGVEAGERPVGQS